MDSETEVELKWFSRYMRNLMQIYLKISALVAVLVSVANPVAAQPNASGLSGDTIHGGVITVTGARFGNNGDELPLKFDDFESGALSARLSSGGWSVSNANGPDDPVYSNTFAFSGTKSGYADMRVGGDSGAYLSDINTEKIYASFRFRYRMNSTPSTQKGFRVNANDGPNLFSSQPNVNIQDYATSNRASISPNETGEGKYSLYGLPNLSQNRWYRLEYYFALSSPAGSDNGEVWASHDLKVVENARGMNTRGTGVTDNYQVAMLPFYFGNGGGGEVWYDDVYISRTKARIEIGNNASWSACTKRAIQQPLEWSSNAITFKINLAGFSSNDNLYLFVVDHTGAISNGLEMVEVVRPLPPADFD